MQSGQSKTVYCCLVFRIALPHCAKFFPIMMYYFFGYGDIHLEPSSSAKCKLCLVLQRLLGHVPRIAYCWRLFPHQALCVQPHSQVEQSLQKMRLKRGCSAVCRGTAATFLSLQDQAPLKFCRTYFELV